VLLATSGAIAQILVLAPHPDDDILTAAGVTFDAVRRGEPVTIVYFTNGDKNGTDIGLTRQDEAVTAQLTYLGTLESELIFLGYPDGYTQTVYDEYPDVTDAFEAANGQSETYGNRGLGGADYHFYRFGTHALYNRPNMVLDLKTILQTYRPAHIYVTSPYDHHPDHAMAYRVLKDALAAVLSDASYKPVVHTTIVHSPCCDPTMGGHTPYWPDPENPTTYHSILPDIPTTVPLVWGQRESLDVPLVMQQINSGQNIKILAIEAHESQASDENFLQRFAHKDEFFWVEDPRGLNTPPIVNAGLDQAVQAGALVSLNGGGSVDPEGLPLTFTWSQAEGPTVALAGANTATPSFTAPQVSQITKFVFRLVVSDGAFGSPPDLVTVTVTPAGTSATNIAPLAAVTASSDNPADGQQAIKAVDGVVDGWPGDYTREWATTGQGAGAWIKLAWSSAYLVDHVVLHDRPNSNDRVLAGTLTFSDGSTVSVGALANNGSGTTVSFTARTITSVTFTITSVSSATENIGLAEFEVYGSQGPPTIPASPTGLTATAASFSQINLTWVDNATNETSYRVERSPDGVSFASVAVLGANTTTFSDTGLAASTIYYYRVLAANSVGNSGYSNIASATTPAAPTVPAAPTGLTATAVSSSQINLTWVDNATNETSYRVERSTDATTFTTLVTLGANVTTYSNTGLTASTTYYYRVLASNSVGNSAYSNTASATTAPPPPPATPSGLTATAVSSSQINLTWVDNATNETSYQVERSPDGTTFTALVTLGANVTTYSNTGLTASTTYFYRVRAANGGGNSAYSNVASATTTGLPPAAPTGLTATAVSSSQINLTWVDNATNETSYRVERSPDGTTFTTLTTLGANVTTYSNTGLVASTTYFYRVLASNNAGNSAYSNIASATTSPPPPPAAPSGLTATAVSSSQINLTWVDNATNETSYRVERSPDGTTFTALVTLGANVTTYSNTGLTASTTYFYRVLASNSGGDSAYSNVTSATTQAPPPPPAAPTGLTATAVSSTQINLTWVDNATNETSYRVERSPDGVSFASVATLGANVTTYANTGLAAATTYYYRVVAANGTGDSGYSNIASATTSAAASTNIAPLAAVTASSENPADGQQAIKAVDGVVDGWPGDYTREWATIGQGAGAWIKLTWTTPYTVDRIVLYDRPNTTDRVTAGTLTFSDGTTVTVGSLTNNGAATTVTFTARTTTSVTFTITRVSAATQNIGLAEIQVYGR
jgi:LmbE family N-acetylglucosaminyl deacetylase/3-mercaptopyruvate sulfurtransferase SseA